MQFLERAMTGTTCCVGQVQVWDVGQFSYFILVVLFIVAVIAVEETQCIDAVEERSI